MKPLNKQFAPKSVMPEKVIQFGEGNFLRPCICRLDYLEHGPEDRLQRFCRCCTAY